MSLYNLLFGKNPNTELVLALIGLKECDIERFRDCGIDFDNKQIWVHTRTGGGNRESYPNGILTGNPYYLGDEDCEGDSTYANYYFRFPDEIAADIEDLKDITTNGISAKLIAHVLRVVNRKPTDNDKYAQAYRKQMKVVEELRCCHEVDVWNGHTVVPLSDYAMERLLEVCEENDGDFVAYWWIMPYKICVRENQTKSLWEAKKPEIEQCKYRVFIDTTKRWEIDKEWWERWQTKFADKYPKSMAKLTEDIAKHS